MKSSLSSKTGRFSVNFQNIALRMRECTSCNLLVTQHLRAQQKKPKTFPISRKTFVIRLSRQLGNSHPILVPGYNQTFECRQSQLVLSVTRKRRRINSDLRLDTFLAVPVLLCLAGSSCLRAKRGGAKIFCLAFPKNFVILVFYSNCPFSVVFCFCQVGTQYDIIGSLRERTMQT